jgi:phosphate-selective porin OprO and OprP
VSGAQVYSLEVAGTYGPFFAQGEYYWYNVDRGVLPGLPSVKFDGGYAEASYVLTGETRTYNSAAAAYNGIVPINPFSLTGGGSGAWELAGRVSRGLKQTGCSNLLTRRGLAIFGRRRQVAPDRE